MSAATNKGKKRVHCQHPGGCDKTGYLTICEKSCLDDDGVPWMCPKHDEQRVFRENAR
jgi:hypothetical protein